MSTSSFPESLDNISAPTATGPSYLTIIMAVRDALNAVQAKVGTDTSTTATSLDYKMASQVTAHDSLSESHTTLQSQVDALRVQVDRICLALLFVGIDIDDNAFQS